MINDPEKPWTGAEINDKTTRIDLFTGGSYEWNTLHDIINDLVTRLAAAESEIAALKAERLYRLFGIGDAK